jgi:hypothetical protein
VSDGRQGNVYGVCDAAWVRGKRLQSGAAVWQELWLCTVATSTCFGLGLTLSGYRSSKVTIAEVRTRGQEHVERWAENVAVTGSWTRVRGYRLRAKCVAEVNSRPMQRDAVEA